MKHHPWRPNRSPTTTWSTRWFQYDSSSPTKKHAHTDRVKKKLQTTPMRRSKRCFGLDFDQQKKELQTWRVHYAHFDPQN